VIPTITTRTRLAAVTLALVLCRGAHAQQPMSSNSRQPGAPETMAVDGRIAAALQQVSAERIRACLLYTSRCV